MNSILEKIVSEKGKEYDVAVMYSGGKDSAYLLYLLKEVYKLRVVAVMVDNGYEHDYTWEPMECFTKRLDVPLVVIKPENEMFTKLFQILIMEHEKFARDGVNHICFICNNLLWCCVAKYAMENGIPYVASGLSLAQLNSGRSKPLLPDEMATPLAERSTRMIYRNAVESMKDTKIFRESQEFQKFISDLGVAIKSVRTIYPYIYHSISVEDQKKCLQQMGWVPPSLRSVNDYISSGCRMMRGVVFELEKIGMITLNEREQAKAMVKDKLMGEDQLAFAEKDVSNETVNLNAKELQELQVVDYLEKICQKKGKKYEK